MKYRDCEAHIHSKHHSAVHSRGLLHAKIPYWTIFGNSCLSRAYGYDGRRGFSVRSTTVICSRVHSWLALQSPVLSAVGSLLAALVRVDWSLVAILGLAAFGTPCSSSRRCCPCPRRRHTYPHPHSHRRIPKLFPGLAMGDMIGSKVDGCFLLKSRPCWGTQLHHRTLVQRI